MTLTWFGHSCFKIDDGISSVVFDPYQPESVPGLALPRIKADMCICSHGHHDHFYPQGVEPTGAPSALAVEQIDTFHDACGGAVRGENKCTVIQLGGLRFAHMGDIGCPLSELQLLKLGRVDVLMLPVGGYYTIDAGAAKQLKDALDPFITIPMHYRGAGFGYDNIAAVDAFTKLCDDVIYFDSNVLELETVKRKCTAVLKCPVKGACGG